MRLKTAATSVQPSDGAGDTIGARPGDGLSLLLLVGLGVVGALVILHVTRNGIGLSPDSSAYIEGARRLAQGEGFSARSNDSGPITHWPPLYSTLLAILDLLGLDPLSGARAVAPLLFGANVFVAGWLVWRHGSGGVLPAMASSLLVIVSADLLTVHAMAWSEPLFFLLCALGIHHLVVYLGQLDSRRLMAAAALIGLAALARYVGVALIMGGGLAILWLAAAGWFWRVKHTLLFVTVSSAPLAIWMLRNVVATGGTSGRDLVVNLIGLGQVFRAARTASGWLVPPILPGSLRMLLLMGAVAAIMIAIVRGRAVIGAVLASPGARLLKTLVCVVVVYVMFLAVAISLFDAGAKFNERMLSPAHFLLLIAAGVVLAGAQDARRWMYAGLGVVVILQAVHAVSWARAAEQGLGYSAPVWRESTLWSMIEQLPDEAPLYSNAWDAVYLYTGRLTRPLPGKFNVNSLVPHRDYQDRLASLRAELAHSRGFVVYVPMVSWRSYMPTDAELEEALGPVSARRLPDGTLYEVLEVSPGTAPDSVTR